MNQPQSSFAVSQATSAAARWFDHNRNRYTAEDEDLFDALLGLIERPLHLLALSEELERRMLPHPKAKDRAPEQPYGKGYVAPQVPRLIETITRT